MKLKLLYIIFLCAFVVTACKKSENTGPVDGTTTPKITSLIADKTEIKVGGEDPSIITCEATGGNIQYKWEVDLGDIFPLNETGSQVRFTGSECCLGEKVIKCTISNDKGSDEQVIVINIFIP